MQSATSNLPAKEAKLLKQLFSFYENKQYKKGIKQADKILETQPDHPETCSLKGLFLFLEGEKDEGLKLANAALLNSMKLKQNSSLNWHILGIINRAQKKFQEAIGCYRNALKFDGTNLNILRDMACLQIHIRELPDHSETRRKLLLEKSNLPVNWVAMAVAEHLNGEYEEALRVLKSFKNVVKKEDLKKFENSEIILYEVTIMMDMKNHKGALEYLEKSEKEIVDKTAFHEFSIKCLFALGNPEQTESHIQWLIEKYPENHNYITYLRERHGLSEDKPENNEKISALLDEVAKKNKSSTIQRLQLRYLEGEKFRNAFDQYIRPFFIKGLPSVFSDVKEFLKSPEKAKIIEDLVLAHEKSLTEKETFAGSETKESPCCLLWSYLFLAELYDYLGQFQKSLDYADKGILHTPTLLELYMIKAKVYKHNRNFKAACELADKTRNMDLADRYPNNLTVKYRARNGEIDVSDGLIKGFLRDSNEEHLHELQYLWYEYEVGNFNLRAKKYGPAFRQFKFIEKHFEEFYEDQFDFHTYCLRKYQLRAYIDMVRQQDKVYDNDWYVKATIGIVKGLAEYEQLLPELKKKEEEEAKLLSEMDAQERKKYKKEKEAKEKETDPVKEKLDISGKKYLEGLKNPLEEACTFASKLLTCNITTKKWRVRGYATLVHLFIKKGKLLTALKAYNRIASFADWCPIAHLARVAIVDALEQASGNADISPDVKAVVDEELAKHRGGKSLKEIHEAFSKIANSNLLSYTRWLQGSILLKTVERQKAVEMILAQADKLKATCSIKEALDTLDHLRDDLSASNEEQLKFKKLFSERFNLSPIFNDEAANIKALIDLPTPVLVSGGASQ